VGLVREGLRYAEGKDLDPEWAAKLDGYRARFEEVMDDDFSTPRAIATLFDLGRQVNSLLNSGQPVSRATLGAIDDLYQALGGDVLGILLDDQGGPSHASQADNELVDGLVRMLIDMRQEARQAGDWARADAIRDHLADMGVALDDGPEGTRWRLSR
jgi:cysteinyl-tRNA synthetase